MRMAAVAVCGVAAAPILLGRVEQQPRLKDLLPRVTAYVSQYGERASVIVATEHYTQTAERNFSDQASGGGVPPRQSRTLISDFAIVKTSLGWAGFRDVLTVDGKDVRDHDDRLARLLAAGPGGIDDARRVSEESARYNIGFAFRNFNVPTAALFFFTPDNASRLRFSMDSASANGAHLSFRETAPAGLIHRPDGQPVPVNGGLWVRPADGTVTRTILQMSNFGGANAPGHTHAEIDVTYRLVPDMQMWLPAEMTELYENRDGLNLTRDAGRATYSNYRRFQTSVRIK